MKKPKIFMKPKVFETNLTCIVCGEVKIRKKTRTKGLESIVKFLSRKTCGKFWNGEKYIGSDCFKQNLIGKRNPNYKGYMPKCKICSKRVSYKLKEDMAEGKFIRYCMKHAKESFKFGELHDEITKRNRKHAKEGKNLKKQLRKE